MDLTAHPNPRHPLHARGIALMLVTGLLWSIAGVVTRHIELAPRWEITFWRSFFCAVAMVVILLIQHRGDALRHVRRIGRIGLLSGALWAVMFTCFMLALTQTTTANTLILTSLSPLAASVIAWIVLGERITLRTWALIGVALCGVTIMFGGEVGTGRLAGNLIALAVPLAAGLNFTLMRAARGRVDLVPAVLLGGGLSSLLTLPFALPFQANHHDLALLALLGTMQLAVPCALVVIAARYLSAADVALIALSENVFGPLWAWLGAGEAASRQALMGGALVLAALMIQALAGRRS